MDFSRWAVVSYKDDTGLGRQATDLRSVLGLGYRLVVPSKVIEGHPVDGPGERPLNPGFDDAGVSDALGGIDGIIFPELHSWHPRLLPVARQLGVKTVCIPNWEWFKGTDENWKLVDLFVCQSRFTEQIVRGYGFRNTVHIPVAIDLSRFPYRRVSGKGRLFVHNAGIVNEDDRKGTRDSILAFKKVRDKSVRLIVRMQKEVPLPPLDERIEVLVGNLEDPSALYSEGDVAVQPSKMEGNGFMVLEPLCTGMPVITTDYPPMNEYVRQKEMLVRKRWFKRRAFPTQWVPHAHLRLPDINDLARKIEWCAANDLTEIAEQNRRLAEEIMSPDYLRSRWGGVLDALMDGRLEDFISREQLAVGS